MGKDSVQDLIFCISCLLLNLHFGCHVALSDVYDKVTEFLTEIPRRRKQVSKACSDPALQLTSIPKHFQKQNIYIYIWLKEYLNRKQFIPVLISYSIPPPRTYCIFSEGQWHGHSQEPTVEWQPRSPYSWGSHFYRLEKIINKINKSIWNFQMGMTALKIITKSQKQRGLSSLGEWSEEDPFRRGNTWAETWRMRRYQPWDSWGRVFIDAFIFYF